MLNNTFCHSPPNTVSKKQDFSSSGAESLLYFPTNSHVFYTHTNTLLLIQFGPKVTTSFLHVTVRKVCCQRRNSGVEFLHQQKHSQNEATLKSSCQSPVSCESTSQLESVICGLISALDIVSCVECMKLKATQTILKRSVKCQKYSCRWGKRKAKPVQIHRGGLFVTFQCDTLRLSKCLDRAG